MTSAFCFRDLSRSWVVGCLTWRRKGEERGGDILANFSDISLTFSKHISRYPLTAIVRFIRRDNTLSISRFRNLVLCMSRKGFFAAWFYIAPYHILIRLG